MDSPTALDWITGINKCLVVGDVYKAIKLAKEQRWPPGSQVIAKAS